MVKGKVKVGLVPGTMVNGTLNQRSILASGNSLSVWATTPIPEAAYLFAQWITSPEIAAKRSSSQVSGSIPHCRHHEPAGQSRLRGRNDGCLW